MAYGFLKRLDVDGFDLDDGELLAMALLPLVALALALLENDDLFAAFIFEDGGLYGSARQGGLANPEIGALAGSENLIDFHSRTLLGAGKTVDD